MKQTGLLFVAIMAVVLLFSAPAVSQDSDPATITGTVGDFSVGSRTYEINGSIYQFAPTTRVENRLGQKLSFSHIQGGHLVRLHREILTDPDGKTRIVFSKIVILRD